MSDGSPRGAIAAAEAGARRAALLPLHAVTESCPPVQVHAALIQAPPGGAPRDAAPPPPREPAARDALALRPATAPVEVPLLTGELLGPDGRRTEAGSPAGGTLTGSPGYRAFLLRNTLTAAATERARAAWERQREIQYVEERRTATRIDIWV